MILFCAQVSRWWGGGGAELLNIFLRAIAYLGSENNFKIGRKNKILNLLVSM
jgi:hypothetical protein